MKILKLTLCLGVFSLLVAACSKDKNTDIRDRFLGRFDVKQACSVDGQTGPFAINIVKATSDADKIILGEHEFYGFNYQPYLIVSGSRAILEAQKFYIRQPSGSQFELSYEFKGEGSILGDTLTIHYEVYSHTGSLGGTDIRLVDDCTYKAGRRTQ